MELYLMPVALVQVPLLSYTAGQLLERAAKKHPDKNAFIFPTPGVRLTFQQLLQKVFWIIFNSKGKFLCMYEYVQK